MIRQSASQRKCLVSVFALLFVIGCKQEEPNIPAAEYPTKMAFGYCEAVYSCPCETYPYDNFNQCYGAMTGAYDKVNDAAFLAGLAYDGSCPAKELQLVEQLECKNWLPDPPSSVCVRPCNAWYGPFGAGQVCTVVASAPELGVSFSTCAQGLTCFAGVCVDPCQVGGGLPGIGQPCPDLVCEAGAMCDVDSQICVAMPTLPGPAEPCLNGQCDPDRAVCVPDANICAALPAAGQPCVQNQCDRSSYCGANDVCVALPPLVCGLLAGGVPGDGDGDGDPTGDGDGDGDFGAANVAACNNYLDTIYSLECWDPLYDPMIDCSVYAATTCDISGYFSCMAAAYYCEGGLLNVDALAVQDCASMATC